MDTPKLWVAYIKNSISQLRKPGLIPEAVVSVSLRLLLILL